MHTRRTRTVRKPQRSIDFMNRMFFKFRRPESLFVQVVSSFFGVGAPEAALVGVVAVVVFGPQGLIDVRLFHDSTFSTELAWMQYYLDGLGM